LSEVLKLEYDNEISHQIANILRLLTNASKEAERARLHSCFQRIIDYVSRTTNLSPHCMEMMLFVKLMEQFETRVCELRENTKPSPDKTAEMEEILNQMFYQMLHLYGTFVIPSQDFIDRNPSQSFLDRITDDVPLTFPSYPLTDEDVPLTIPSYPLTNEDVPLTFSSYPLTDDD